MGKFSTEGFIKKRVNVEDSNVTMTFGQKRQASAYDVANGRIFLIGMPGSGRRALAELLAKHYNADVVVPDTPEAAAFDVNAFTACCKETGIIVVPPYQALRDAKVRAAVKESGKVFYLMGEVLRCSHRLGLDDGQREAFATEFAEMEPIFMMTLHNILQGWKEPEELVESVVEQLSLT